MLYVRGELGALRARRRGATASRSSARARDSPYGLEQARGLGRGLAAAGLTVVSGMALGVDAAAHVGALEAERRRRVAVLAVRPRAAVPGEQAAAARADRRDAAPSSPSCRPGRRARRWCFPARNRIIAALARATVVVEAGERSGSLITAALAADLGREVARGARAS